jgi:quinol monooxygenase YgiN
MAYSLTITLRCRDGDQETFRRVLTDTTAPSQAEPGSLAWQSHQSVEDPSLFFIYESYVDENAYRAHLATPAFKRVEDELFPLLADREVRTFVTIDA